MVLLLTNLGYIIMCQISVIYPTDSEIKFKLLYSREEIKNLWGDEKLLQAMRIIPVRITDDSELKNYDGQ